MLLTYQGNKRRVVNNLLPLFPKHNYYVEPFFGSGSVFFNKEQAEFNCLSDIQASLINFFRVVQKHTEEFCRVYNEITYDIFDENLFKVLKPQQLIQTDQTDIERAVDFLKLNKLAFGGSSSRDNKTFGLHKGDGRQSVLVNPEKLIKRAQLMKEKLQGALVLCRSWDYVVYLIEKNDNKENIFFYLDPPYLSQADYCAGTFELEDLLKIREFMTQTKCKVALSLNEEPQTNKIFSKFEKTVVQEIKYLTSRVNNKQEAVKGTEVLFTNYTVGRD
jgi:DNA adenine methylase